MDRQGGDPLRIKEEVAAAVVEKLREEIAGSGSRKGKRRIENLAAHNLYLQGRYHLSQRTDEGLRGAVEFFNKAITQDSQYAEAYSGLADAYGLLAHYGVLTPAEVWTKAASNATQAVLLTTSRRRILPWRM
jgi:serine/threonine-protein kinase